MTGAGGDPRHAQRRGLRPPSGVPRGAPRQQQIPDFGGAAEVLLRWSHLPASPHRPAGDRDSRALVSSAVVRPAAAPAAMSPAAAAQAGRVDLSAPRCSGAGLSAQRSLLRWEPALSSQEAPQSLETEALSSQEASSKTARRSQAEAPSSRAPSSRAPSSRAPSADRPDPAALPAPRAEPDPSRRARVCGSERAASDRPRAEL